MLSNKKKESIIILPIGIAYSEVSPRFRGKFSLCFGEPIDIKDHVDLSIKEFNKILYEKMINAEKKALNNVGR